MHCTGRPCAVRPDEGGPAQKALKRLSCDVVDYLCCSVDDKLAFWACQGGKREHARSWTLALASPKAEKIQCSTPKLEVAAVGKSTLVYYPPHSEHA